VIPLIPCTPVPLPTPTLGVSTLLTNTFDEMSISPRLTATAVLYWE